MCRNDFHTHFRINTMYSAFSEAIRHILFYISKVSLSLAQNGFKYHGIYYNEQEQRLKVKYTFNGQTLDEDCDSFTRSPYIKAISGKQLKEIIDKICETRSKNKIYKIELIDEPPDIFIVKNTITHLSEKRLLSDVVSDSKLLENTDADAIKLVINSAVKLANSGYNTILTQYDSDDAATSLSSSNILRFPTRDSHVQ